MQYFESILVNIYKSKVVNAESAEQTVSLSWEATEHF